jgi:hypothetical protein
MCYYNILDVMYNCKTILAPNNSNLKFIKYFNTMNKIIMYFVDKTLTSPIVYIYYY